MGEFDWHKCRFLESSENLKPLVHARVGRTPSTSIAREIAACLQQGRLFYEAAASAPLEIRPLQLFYGMVGFAKALIIARRLASLSTLRHAHGISDVSKGNSRIAELRVKIGEAGTFQEFNDVVADLTRLCYYGESTSPRAVYLPSVKSNRLAGIELSLRDILSRVPGLESLFRITFDEDARTGPISVQNHFHDSDYWELRIDDPMLFRDRESLKTIVERWRVRFPFLNTWCLVSAQHAWGYSVIQFGNISNTGIDEFGEDFLVGEGDHYVAKSPKERRSDRFLFSERLPPLGGGYAEGNAYAISPVNGSYLSEFSLHYLGLFLLSSLVRYRPQTWVHAISRTGISEAPADDQAVSLVERFLDLNSADFPSLIVTVLNPHEDRYA